MSVYAGPQVIANSLVLWIEPRTYVSGATTLDDLSGYGNTGTLINSATYDTTANGCIAMTSASQQCISVGSPNLQSDFTLSCWIYPTALGSPQCGVFGQGAAGVANSGLHVVYTSDTTMKFGMYANDLDFNLTTPINNWYYFNFTYLNSGGFTKQVYLNGSQIASANQGQYLGSGTFRIGASFGTGATQFCSGKMTSITIHNRVLRDQEIYQSFNAQRSRFGV